MDSYVRRIDELKRVIIPDNICSKMGINPGSKIELEFDENQQTIVIKNSISQCICCGGETSLRALPRNQYICKSCLDSLK